MEINCKFAFIVFPESERLYTVKIFKASIAQKEHSIKSFKGTHFKGKKNKDVQCIQFLKDVNYFPRGLIKHFPNLTTLIIVGGAIKEISKNDLAGLQGLVRFYIQKSSLTSVPDDLFTEMPNLRTISFSGNQIEFTSSKFLEPLLGRQNVEVSLRGNKNIDVRLWPKQSDSVESLYELMKFIDDEANKSADRIPDYNPKLKELWETGRFSDLSIIADESEFRVHKNVLGMQSSVFSDILEDQTDADVIIIPGFSAKSVETMLNFIYTTETTDYEDLKENFKIANHFNVDSMKSIYEKLICDQLDDSNALKHFLFAHRFNSQLIKKKAFQLIATKLHEDLPVTLMEDPQKLKKLLNHRESYEEILSEAKIELSVLKETLGNE